MLISLINVYYSKIQMNGSLGVWTRGTPLPVPISNLAAIAPGGRIFAIGGWDGNGPLPSFSIADVVADGSLGPWSVGPSLPVPLYLQAAAASEKYVYVSGGSDNAQNYNTVYSIALPPPLNTPDLTPPTVTAASFNYDATQPSITVPIQ